MFNGEQKNNGTDKKKEKKECFKHFMLLLLVGWLVDLI